MTSRLFGMHLLQADWLSDGRIGTVVFRLVSSWPLEIIDKPFTESKAEATMTREVATTDHNERSQVTTTDHIHELDELLNKYRLNQFLHNCKNHQDNRTYCQLRTKGIEHRKKWWTRRVEREAKSGPKFQEECSELNLIENHEGILVCREFKSSIQSISLIITLTSRRWKKNPFAYA